jgi:hypothetical protein
MILAHLGDVALAYTRFQQPMSFVRFEMRKTTMTELSYQR